MSINEYQPDYSSWDIFCVNRGIVGKYVSPQVLSYGKKKLVTFVKNKIIMILYINGENIEKMGYLCSIYDKSSDNLSDNSGLPSPAFHNSEKIRCFGGDINDMISQYKLEIILEKYYLVNLPI